MSSDEGLCGICGVTGPLKEIQEHFFDAHTDAGTCEEMDPIDDQGKLALYVFRVYNNKYNKAPDKCYLSNSQLDFKLN